MSAAARIDVVVVSYNSRAELPNAVTPLLDADDISVVVVDNASSDSSLDALAGVPVRTIQLDVNGGFAHGCNVGWRSGSAPYVLFLNPDGTIDVPSVRRLASELDDDAEAGLVAPRIVTVDGSLDHSLRRFPRLRSTFAQALFLHRLFPAAAWTDEVIRDAAAYERGAVAEWVSGACFMVRRSLLEELDGLDEGYFLYCEDIDLCRRIRSRGRTIRFIPEATAVHAGGGSAPRAALLPVLAAARIRYARIHGGPTTALLERAGVALGAVTHMLGGRGGRAARAGHLRALEVALRAPRTPSRPAR